MKILNHLCLVFAYAARSVHAQGALVYDQESMSGTVYPYGGIEIQYNGPLGQSFTPSLSSVGFVRLNLTDRFPGNALGATLVINLRSNAINGPILGTTTPVELSDSFAGQASFFYASAIAVVPNTKYYFEAIVQSGDHWGITTLFLSDYSRGDFYAGASPAIGTDLWFSEGIVVPEPSSALLFLVGGGVAGCILRRAKSRRNGARELRGSAW